MELANRKSIPQNMSLKYAIACTRKKSPCNINVFVTYEEESLQTDCTIFARK
jgi:hypothetical protein